VGRHCERRRRTETEEALTRQNTRTLSGDPPPSLLNGGRNAECGAYAAWAPAEARSEPYTAGETKTARDLRMNGHEPCFRCSKLICVVCPRQDSNLRTRLRRAVLYPLSYGGHWRKDLRQNR
jgi:hypothetical protein